MEYNTIVVSQKQSVLRLQINRPEANNTINNELIVEIASVMDDVEKDSSINVVILEGLPEVFCYGADFNEIAQQNTLVNEEKSLADSKGGYYELMEKISQVSAIVIANVRGKVNAGGVGIVAACDLVVADESATFSCSELLFGLLPAQVMPFLIRRVGFQKAYRMTILTNPIDAATAFQWGLADEWGEDSKDKLRKMILRSRSLSKLSIKRLKAYMKELWGVNEETKSLAIMTSEQLFADTKIQENIMRYVEKGEVPW